MGEAGAHRSSSLLCVSLVFAKRFRQVPPAIVATSQLTASTLIMIPVVLYDQRREQSVRREPASLARRLRSRPAVHRLCIYPVFQPVASAGATNASLVTLVVPVSAILLGALFLGERLEFFEVFGMMLIGLGLVTIDGRLIKRR